MTEAMTRHSTLVVERLDNIGIHYARALQS